MEIESGIAIPKALRNRKWKDLLEKMQVNQSVLFADEDEANSFRYAGYYHGYKMRRRKMEDGFRVWMVA